MASLIKVVVAVLVGVLLGLIVTIQSLDRANSSVIVGPWRNGGHENNGRVDPYVLAADARSGLLPIGTSEGLTFVASTDSSGGPLSARCDYSVGGTPPAARFWTLSLLTPEGFPIQNPAARYGFTSGEVLRLSDTPITVMVSADARSGNWLPTGQAKRYVLMLRLYDTVLTTVGTKLEATALPAIRRLSCR